jgi:glycosyltransferase involved in cell wall biosynthesis
LGTAPLVSVVTPFYNSLETLTECIESVLRQTYQNWEYILVDNHSSDGSSAIAASYAARLPGKVRVTSPEKFLQQVPNYNFALTCIAAASEYCKVVQADDWIFPECLERMVGLAQRDASIGIVGSYRMKGDQVLGSGLNYDAQVLKGDALCRLQLTTSLFAFGTPTTVLYRSELVRGYQPFYDEKTLFDDTDACYRILSSWNFGFVHQVLSYSRVGNDSIMTRAQDFEPGYLDRFLQLSKFGCKYLGREEYTREMHAWKRQYYRFLARRLLTGADASFWQYHSSGLATAGLRIERAALFRSLLLESLSCVANPGDTLRRVVSALTGRRRRHYKR